MSNAIITDFDGTLVDTFEANFRAYQKAFYEVGLNLTEERYRECFGYRYDDFMMAMGITDEVTKQRIRELKKNYYPEFFAHLRLNNRLVEILRQNHDSGGMNAIASTARKENLMNVVEYLHVGDLFDLIYAGDDVKKAKPDPEIYLLTMQNLGVTPSETMIYEDSEVGIQAAMTSGAECMRVTEEWFGEVRKFGNSEMRKFGEK